MSGTDLPSFGLTGSGVGACVESLQPLPAPDRRCPIPGRFSEYPPSLASMQTQPVCATLPKDLDCIPANLASTSRTSHFRAAKARISASLTRTSASGR
eukprot:1143796-Rhodomonas_salina.1